MKTPRRSGRATLTAALLASSLAPWPAVWPMPRPTAAQTVTAPQTAATAVAARARLLAEYAAPFLERGLVPILLPRGQSPGDVLAAGGELLFEGRECFADLAPRDGPAALIPSNVEVSWGAAARLALGADEAASASARGNAEDLVNLRFEGARARAVSRDQLRRTVRPEVCPEVASVLREGAEPPAERWVVLGEVITARPTVRVRRASGGGAQANLGFLQNIGQRLGVRVQAEGGVDLDRADVAEVTVAEQVPVAFRPAMVVVTPELAQRFRSGGAAASDRPALEAFNPRDEAHRAALDVWAARYIESVAAVAER